MNVITKISVLLMLMILCATGALCQANASKNQVTMDSAKVDSLIKLHGELQKRKSDKAMLERIIESLNQVDSVYRVHYPTWIIEGEDVRQRIIKAFRNRQKFAPQRTPIHVITNPALDEIADISILGASSMGRGEVRLFLSENLRKAILDTYTPHGEESGHEEASIRSLLPNTPPDRVAVEASLFGGSLKFANGWGTEIKVGYDEIGFPFWSSGSARMFLTIDHLKLGVLVPINTGLSQPDLLGPVTLLSRKLNGAPGFAVEFFQPLSSNKKIELRFTSGSMAKLEPDDQITDTSDAYFIHTVGQIDYAQDFSFGGGNYLFTAKIGMGFHRIGRAALQADKTFNTIEKNDYGSPYIKLDYVRHGIQMYGFEVQYYSSIVSLTAWTELVKNFVYIDVKYSTPLFRSPQSWEQPYFFMLSPRFRFAF